MDLIRKKHNQIKFDLLKTAIGKLRIDKPNRVLNLLDLGVGRANDIHKWIKYKVNKVIGVDSSESQLGEARRRIDEMKPEFEIVLQQIDLSNRDSIQHFLKIDHQIDIIVAFFSIHYFYKNIDFILSSINKSPDCQFMCTYMNVSAGFNIYSQDLFSKHDVLVETDLIAIKKISDEEIVVKFKETPYFQEDMFTEYIINNSLFISLIKKHFPNHQVRNFIDFYDDINSLAENVIQVELLHQAMFT